MPDKANMKDKLDTLLKKAEDLGVIGIEKFPSGTSTEEEILELEHCFNIIAQKTAG